MHRLFEPGPAIATSPREIFTGSLALLLYIFTWQIRWGGVCELVPEQQRGPANGRKCTFFMIPSIILSAHVLASLQPLGQDDNGGIIV